MEQVLRENVASLQKPGGPAPGIGHTRPTMEQVTSIPAGLRQKGRRPATKTGKHRVLHLSQKKRIFAVPTFCLGGGMVDTRDLNHLSALSEKRDVECRKFKETLTGKAEGNLEPSL